MEEQIWTVPAARAKCGAPIRRPIPTRVMMLLQETAARSRLKGGPVCRSPVNPKRSLSSASLIQLAERVRDKLDLPYWRMHDMRRTLSTRLSEERVMPGIQIISATLMDEWRGGQLLIGGTLLLAKVKSSITMSYQQLTEGNDTSYRCFAHRGCPSLPPHAPLAFIAPPLTGSCVVTPGRRATSQTMRISTPPTDGPVRQISAICRCHPVCRADTRLVVEPGADKRGGQQIGLMVSHEWIYRHVAADKARGGQLYRHLRQGHKRYRRASSLRSPIKEARSIDERPVIVDSRSGSVIGRRTRCWASKAQVHWSPWWSARAGSIWSSGSRANRLGWCGMR